MAFVCFFLKKNGIRPSLSIYLTKKQAPLPVAYLSMSKKSERLRAIVRYLREKNATQKCSEMQPPQPPQPLPPAEAPQPPQSLPPAEEVKSCLKYPDSSLS